jgi:hypothetical protein
LKAIRSHTLRAADLSTLLTLLAGLADTPTSWVLTGVVTNTLLRAPGIHSFASSCFANRSTPHGKDPPVQTATSTTYTLRSARHRGVQHKKRLSETSLSSQHWIAVTAIVCEYPLSHPFKCSDLVAFSLFVLARTTLRFLLYTQNVTPNGVLL